MRFAGLDAFFPKFLVGLAAGMLLAGLGTSSFGQTQPETISASPQREINRLLEEAIAAAKLPGAVVRVQRGDQVLLDKAWGRRQVEPQPDPLTTDCIFDLASLTKPIATSTAIAILVEKGKLAYSDKVVKHWPEFGQNGKEAVTVEQLLLHTSGLTADNSIKDYAGSPEESLTNICRLKLEAQPGTRFQYSDVGFIVLGELVKRLSGTPLDQFCAREIFLPLKMTSTSFGVPKEKRTKVAPAEKREGQWILGEVHDPRAFRLGGVAGHAGLFSNAADLARFARMVLNGGELEGTRILSKKSVETWTTPKPVPGGWRTLGWDCDTGYSSNRGTAFYPRRGFGHTGFTGTSLWIEPDHKGFVLFLSSRLHPTGKGDVQRLRGQIATEAGHLLGLPKVPEPIVTTGLESLIAAGYAPLKGKKIGLVTNHTGRDRLGRSIVDLLHRAPGVQVKVLFSPEHGIRGALDQPVADGVDPATKLPIVSLYGPRRKPTKDQLKGLDLLVFDIQDAGCRFYTYSSTLGLIMEACSEAGVGVMVLDRPNPIGGTVQAGPLTGQGLESFVAFHKVPVRHGLTLGEMARLYAAERHGAGKPHPEIKLEVIPMKGWKRGLFFDATGIEWVSPSPNLRSIPAALNYPGVGLLEFTNISVGRGTDRPFEWLGAPWMEPHSIIRELKAMGMPGLRFVASSRTPVSSVHARQECRGIDIIVDRLDQVDPLRLGIGLALALRKVHPEIWQVEKMDKLICSKETLEMIKQGQPLETILASFQEGLESFRKRVDPILLYRD